MHRIKILKFDTGYLDQITSIENESFSVPWVSSGFTEEIEIPGSFNFVAFDEKDEIAGYIIFRILFDEIHFLKIAVKKDKRKNGIGQRLIEKMIEESKAKNAHVIYLEVSAANKSAIGLYKKNGFYETGRRFRYYGNEDALNMELITGFSSC